MDTNRLTNLYGGAAGLNNQGRVQQLGNKILKDIDAKDSSVDPSSEAKKPANFLAALNEVKIGADASEVRSTTLVKESQHFLDEKAKPLPLEKKKPVNDYEPDVTTGKIEKEPESEREAMQQFVGEAFYGVLVKQMRSSIWKSDLMGDSSAQKQLEGQFDQMLVQNLAKVSSDKISQPFYDQMQRQRG